MGAIASQITSLTIVYSTVYSGVDQRKHQSSASLAFVLGIQRSPPHKWPVTRKMFPFDDVVVSSGKGTGNTNQYTQHKRNVVFLVRGFRDKRENHVTSGIGLVSRSRVSPVYNQEREN